MHKNLPGKVRYNPYSRPSTPATGSTNPVAGSEDSPLVKAVPMVVQVPHGGITIANTGWDSTTTKVYRVCIYASTVTEGYADFL